MKKSTRSLLLISYFFPPYNPTEHRHAQVIAQAAVRDGWKVHVIAPWAPEIHSHGRSYNWEKECAGPGALIVHRTPSNFAEVVPAFSKIVNSVMRNVDRWSSGHLSAWMIFPDRFVSWVPFAVAQAVSVIRRDRPAVIITSSYPYSAHVVGYLLHALFRKPWIVDTRDGWAVDEYEQFAVMEPLRMRRQRHLCFMRRVVRNACQFWSLTPAIRDATAALFLREPRDKFVAVMQGIAPVPVGRQQDFDSGGSDASSLIIGYAGRFRSKLTPIEPLARALQSVKKQHNANQSCSLKLRVWGSYYAEYHDCLNAQLEQLGILDLFTFLESLPETQLVAYLRECDALLLSNGTSEWTQKRLSGKLFVYLAAQRPILAVCSPDSAIARVISETNTGVVVSPDDREALHRMLYEWSCLRAEGKHIPYSPDMQALKQYSLEEGIFPLIAHKLNDALEGV